MKVETAPLCAVISIVLGRVASDTNSMPGRQKLASCAAHSISYALMAFDCVDTRRKSEQSGSLHCVCAQNLGNAADSKG